ncbi:hypothetical protein I5M32_01895 [Pedobacter sp. SD-b]|uniref:DKNYY family protein n=1 Tax=Pedobacter segetis TaxID=2793069 RepID=A0ABS1BH54_9SPHI|nr:hypothetical protein [Pedobacter segetis]MBK0381701.1 hypothetical protein [Pedobacter segetis]
MKQFLVACILLAETLCGYSQSKISLQEDSLKVLGTQFTSDSLESNRIKANYDFIRLFVSSLKEKNSFAYPYSQLTNFISIKKSDDDKFRTFTWFTQLDDGSYRYYGAIQINNPNKLELYPLVDNTQNLKISDNLADTTLQTNQWYGAIYYNILPVLGIKNPYYILFGWKGKDLRSNSKIIETLSFDKGKPVFGDQVLEDGQKPNDFHSRIVFNYTKDADMMLKYVKNDKIIVFDHLVAPSDKLKGMTDLYAPDLSYDGYKFKSGKWVFQENMKLKNLPEESDDLFIDPSKDSQNTSPVIKN